jgi:hypothetical protein
MEGEVVKQVIQSRSVTARVLVSCLLVGPQLRHIGSSSQLTQPRWG